MTSAPPRPEGLAGSCPVCGSRERVYLFVVQGSPVHRCAACGLTRLDPGHAPVHAPADLVDSTTEQEAAQTYLRRLEERGVAGKALLLVAPAGHLFASAALSHGYKIDGWTSEELGGAPLEAGRYDGAVVILELEKADDPIAALDRIHGALRPGGTLLLVTHSMDRWAARFFGSRWPVWRPDNRYYFDDQTIQAALLRGRFAEIEIRPDRRRYTLEHVYQRARAYPSTGLTRLIQAVYRVAPTALRSARVELATSAVVVTARRAEPRPRPLLSIVMPVYNERATFATTMSAVVAKPLPGMDKEIIVVESNSTDGTRDLVLAYRDHPDVRLILEDRPRGKGHAVRAGLGQARGDIVLIQDADLEYDVDDYDALLEPLRRFERSFVLGSRHLGDWKIREFSGRPGLAALTNAGHLLFVGLLNLLYWQRLRDPFTMYKVFRRDCLHGLAFECDRFDFDFELVIKLLRKGYVPLEIPVNYVSRSFEAGKKVSILRDPPTWVRALIKYRVSPLYRQRRRG